MIYRKLTICIHFGKKDNYPFLENLLKSFLVCNLYPNIEVIIAETGGDKEIRNWLKKIDFNKKFINFNGTITNIKKNKKTNPKLKLLLPKKIYKGKWKDIPYMGSFIKTAYAKDDLNNFYVFLAEDFQFIIKGNIIKQIIDSIRKIGEKDNHVGFSFWPRYRYIKKNNKIKKIYKINKNFSLFKLIEGKGDIWSIISRSIFSKIKIKNSLLPGVKGYHLTVIKLCKAFEENGINRFYPSLAPTIALANDYHNYFKDIIKTNTEKNPDFILLNIFKEKEFIKKFKNSTTKPIEAESIYKTNNWYNTIKTKWYIKNKLRFLKF